MLDRANAEGRRLDGNGYGYKQAFRNNPDFGQLRNLQSLLQKTWGEDPLVADLTAGGGSIPFAAVRLGLRTFANDLNGVAAVTLRAGVQFPAIYGNSLMPDLKKWGQILVDRVSADVDPYFDVRTGERVTAYIWANTINCPRTGKLVPLVNDWTLRSQTGARVAARLLTTTPDGQALDSPRFEVVRGSSIDFDPTVGIARRGSALSPWDHNVIDGDYIKSEAQAGRMGSVLYAIATKNIADGSRDFRVPEDDDLEALARANEALLNQRHNLELAGYLPTEEIPHGNYERGHGMYGMDYWADLFSPRQLMVHSSFAREFRGLIDEVTTDLGHERGDAVLTLLALMQGKALNWNSKMSSWNQLRQGLRSTFEKHNFSFKWTFAEFEGKALYQWSLEQLLDAYGGLASLMESSGFNVSLNEAWRRDVTVTQGNGANVNALADGSVTHLCMDPPYYDNVMYAELSDFFYVWEKRTAGHICPDLFAADLADQENEAVANSARFVSMGRRAKALAEADYEAKMTAIFREGHRILRPDGVLTVMFTHKRAEAWDTLGMGLLNAGFTIESSWPVNTEAEHSLHQSGVNSAASTIMLVCRKHLREKNAVSIAYLEDIEAEVRAAARDAVGRFRGDGIDGVDLLLAAYGPTLSVISRHWPVYSSVADEVGQARLLRPEEGLAVARAEIIRVQRARLVGHPVEFDALTDYSIAFWDLIKDSTATFDEARRLALAVGALDVDELQRAKVVEKKTGTIRLLEPKERVRGRGSDHDAPGVRPAAEGFTSLIDAIHTACYVADEDGLGAAKALLERTGLYKDARFTAAVQALVNAVPRTRIRGAFVLPLASSLDRLIATYLPDVVLPVDEQEALVEEQGDLFSMTKG